jgi:hypothetical protein
MPLINDVDLLTIEPSVFIDAEPASTNLLTLDDGVIAGVALTSASADFVASGIGQGHVAIVNGEALEITERLSGTQLGVSRPRASGDDDAIAPPPGSGLEFKINTFARLIAQTQSDLLAALAIDGDDPDLPLDEADIVNADAVGRYLALRVIERAFSLASAIDVPDESLAARAAHYAALADDLAEGLAVLVDLDGDGEADQARHRRVCVLRRV